MGFSGRKDGKIVNVRVLVEYLGTHFGISMLKEWKRLNSEAKMASGVRIRTGAPDTRDGIREGHSIYMTKTANNVYVSVKLSIVW